MTNVQPRRVVVDHIDEDIDHRQIVIGDGFASGQGLDIAAINAMADQCGAWPFSGGIVNGHYVNGKSGVRRRVVEGQHYRVGEYTTINRDQDTGASIGQILIRVTDHAGGHGEINRIDAQLGRVRVD